jgi:hypothetical protein
MPLDFHCNGAAKGGWEAAGAPAGFASARASNSPAAWPVEIMSDNMLYDIIKDEFIIDMYYYFNNYY